MRQWCPELAHVPREYLHEPWRAPKATMEQAGVCLGVDYPTPIVTLEESEAALAHAWGVVQRCASAPTAPGPYRAPSKQVDVRSFAILILCCLFVQSAQPRQSVQHARLSCCVLLQFF